LNSGLHGGKRYLKTWAKTQPWANEIKQHFLKNSA
jgi:hypothetical protein